eukprot:TRINITY_DN1656_c2_g1_i2.p1 TRINITY_DN1656_c2_g1~~TRINITY_DN1656_c2_g1_i2.p1  ORF type:complete len:526 (-),score=105.91 TRINITY_DN1656_c2_g1_i2:45-1622(-)
MPQGAPQPGHPEWIMDIVPSRHYTAQLRMGYTFPNLVANEWIVTMPSPPSSHPMQTTQNVELRIYDKNDPNPNKAPLAVGSNVDNYLRARFSPSRPSAPSSFECVYQVDLAVSKRAIRKRTPQDPANVVILGERPGNHHLEPTEMMDFSSPVVQQWLAQNNVASHNFDSEPPLAFAFRAFSILRNKFKYTRMESGDRKASAAISMGTGDCGSLSAVYVSILRANGIPSRLVVGRWAKDTGTWDMPTPSGTKPVYHQTHVYAEFWVDGLGWIPTDPSQSVAYDLTPANLAYFGKDSNDFVLFHNEPMFIDTIHFGTKFFDFAQLPVFFATGSGNFDNSTTDQHWTVKDTSPPGTVAGSRLSGGARSGSFGSSGAPRPMPAPGATPSAPPAGAPAPRPMPTPGATPAPVAGAPAPRPMPVPGAAAAKPSPVVIKPAAPAASAPAPAPAPVAAASTARPTPIPPSRPASTSFGRPLPTAGAPAPSAPAPVVPGPAKRPPSGPVVPPPVITPPGSASGGFGDQVDSFWA